MTRQTPTRKPGRASAWGGFCLGLLGYLLVSVREPLEWRMPVWIILAFVVVPGLVGWVAGLGQVPERGICFRAGLRTAGWAMFLYASLTLIVLSHRIPADAGSGQEFWAGLLVSVVYALLAGTVAGLVSMAAGRRRAEQEQAKP